MLKKKTRDAWSICLKRREEFIGNKISNVHYDKKIRPIDFSARYASHYLSIRYFQCVCSQLTCMGWDISFITHWLTSNNYLGLKWFSETSNSRPKPRLVFAIAEQRRPRWIGLGRKQVTCSINHDCPLSRALNIF